MKHGLDAVAAVQRGLESLYRVETELDVRDFLLSGAQRDALWPAGAGRRPDEQLFIHTLPDDESDVQLALYLDEAALEALRQNDPRDGLSDHNLPALLLVLEGVSHFIYTAARARQQRPVSGLELELQAEVDKYVALLLLLWQPVHLGLEDLAYLSRDPRARWDLPEWLITRLFRRVVFDPTLGAEEYQRYRQANAAAASYAGTLRRRFVPAGGAVLRHPHPADIPGLLREVRHFWRLSCADKLSHINRRS